MSGDFSREMKNDHGKVKSSGAINYEGVPEIEFQNNGSFTIKLKDVQGQFTKSVHYSGIMMLGYDTSNYDRIELDYSSDGNFHEPDTSEPFKIKDLFLMFAYTGPVDGAAAHWDHYILQKLE
jgi:hypothetical protein